MNRINKLEIARWIAILPITTISLTLFTSIFIGLFSKTLNTVLNEDTVANIIGYVNAITLPVIIVACAYWVSPKLKFKSCLILAVIFIAIQTWHYFGNEYIRHSIGQYIAFYALSYFITLYLAYTLDKKN